MLSRHRRWGSARRSSARPRTAGSAEAPRPVHPRPRAAEAEAPELPAGSTRPVPSLHSTPWGSRPSPGPQPGHGEQRGSSRVLRACCAPFPLPSGPRNCHPHATDVNRDARCLLALRAQPTPCSCLPTHSTAKQQQAELGARPPGPRHVSQSPLQQATATNKVCPVRCGDVCPPCPLPHLRPDGSCFMRTAGQEDGRRPGSPGCLSGLFFCKRLISRSSHNIFRAFCYTAAAP